MRSYRYPAHLLRDFSRSWRFDLNGYADGGRQKKTGRKHTGSQLRHIGNLLRFSYSPVSVPKRPSVKLVWGKSGHLSIRRFLADHLYGRYFFCPDGSRTELLHYLSGFSRHWNDDCGHRRIDKPYPGPRFYLRISYECSRSRRRDRDRPVCLLCLRFLLSQGEKGSRKNRLFEKEKYLPRDHQKDPFFRCLTLFDPGNRQCSHYCP